MGVTSDAIRLLKSIFGDYQPGEVDRWFGEFQIPRDEFGNPNALVLFNDKSKPMEIACTFQLHETERQYLSDHLEDELTIAAGGHMGKMAGLRLSAAQINENLERVQKFVEDNIEIVKKDLEKQSVDLWVRFDPSGKVEISDAGLMPLLFSRYLPGTLGVIDYHGPQRVFQREIVQSFSVNVDAHREQRRNNALYDYNNKYANVKAELAAGYVKEALAQKANVDLRDNESLTETLSELFATFFPEKKFIGPVPNEEGLLEFPVIGNDGSKHDLNELSAGEKEILYGYLRMRNSAARYSIILLDEPELHLNPGLIRKLPGFYAEHLGRKLDNQIWLITHSDALIRETIGREEFSLFHISSAFHNSDGQNQVERLSAEEDAEQLVIDLVGDLASFRPGGQLVIFEGGGESEYDITLVQKLFPLLQERVNCIAGGGKSRVRSLHEVLDKSTAAGKIPFKISSITDWDGDGDEDCNTKNRYRWDVYHIENYLLEPEFVLAALKSLDIKKFDSPRDVVAALRECARGTIGSLVRHRLLSHVSQQMNSAISLKIGKLGDLADPLAKAVAAANDKLSKLSEGDLGPEKLQKMEETFRAEYEAKLSSGEWLRVFRGRDILTEFAHRYGEGAGYQRLRNLIANRMAEAGYKPEGMSITLAKATAE